MPKGAARELERAKGLESARGLAKAPWDVTLLSPTRGDESEEVTTGLEINEWLERARGEAEMALAPMIDVERGDTAGAPIIPGPVDKDSGEISPEWADRASGDPMVRVPMTEVANGWPIIPA